jgi:hypothetical protein
VVWWSSLALAASLVVEVVPDPPPEPRERLPQPRADALQIGRGDVVIDGQLTEGAWSVGPATLLPIAGGGVPPGTSLRLVAARDGLVVGIAALPAGFQSELGVDPDGLGQAWVRVAVGDGSAAAERCSLGEEERPEEWAIPLRAAPCTPLVGLGIGRTGGDLELLLPWAWIPEAASRMRVGWVVQGAKGQGGTLAASGVAKPFPSSGRRVELPAPGAKLDVVSDVDHGVWRATLTVLRQNGPATWTWSRQTAGRTVDAGTVATAGPGAYVWEMPDLQRQAVVVEARLPGDGPIAGAVSAAVRRRRYEVSLGSPVFDEVLELAYEVPDPARWRVWVTAGEALLGEAWVDVPVGLGRLVVRDPGATGLVRVRVAEEGGRVVMDTTAAPAPR